MMSYGRQETQRLRAESGEPTTEENPLPFETLFGLVFSGLSREQETDLMADHTMKKGLNEFELCKEIGEACYRLKLTDEKAAIKYGIKKSSISRLRMRYSMPTVLAEYRKEKAKGDTMPYVKVGQKALTHLYTCYYADQQAGCAFREEGANFKLAWKEHLQNPESTGVKAEKPKGQDRDAILNQVKSFPATFGTHPEVDAACDILKWAANEEHEGKSLNVQSIMLRLRDYCDSLRTEYDEAVKKVEELTSIVSEHTDTIATLRADLASAETHVRDLENENEKLKHKKAKA